MTLYILVLGDACSLPQECGAQNSECSPSGYCVCKKGFFQVEENCVPGTRSGFIMSQIALDNGDLQKSEGLARKTASAPSAAPVAKEQCAFAEWELLRRPQNKNA